MKNRAWGVFTGLLEDTPTDTFGERLADVAVRNQAEKAGAGFAEHLLKGETVRRVLLAVPAGVLEYLGPVAADYAMSRWLPEHERTREWAKEFAQGFHRRVRESQQGGPQPAAGTAPAVPAGPREMSAAEVLAKKPALLALIERIYPSEAERQPIMARLHVHLNFVHEADMLLSPPPGPAPFDMIAVDNLRARTVALVEHVFPAEDRPVIIETLRRRVGSAADLRMLLGPTQAAAVALPPGARSVLPLVMALWPDETARADALRTLAPYLGSDEDRDFLFSPLAGDEAVPTIVRSSREWQEFLTLLVCIAPEDDRSRLREEVARRVRTVADLQTITAPAQPVIPPEVLERRILDLPEQPMLSAGIVLERLDLLQRVSPPPAFVPTDVSRPEFEARLAALPERAQDINRAVFEQRLVLIEDGRRSRLAAPLRATLESVSHILGGPDQAEAALNQTATALGNLGNRLFGPRT